MYLDKAQLKFLKSLPKKGHVLKEDIKKYDEDTINFLAEEKFVYVEREFKNVQFNVSNHTYKSNGKVISVSRSPRGDAYLAGLRHERRCLYIPVIIDSILAIVAIAISIISLMSQNCP